MPRPYIPWNQSPASLAGAWVAGLHALAAATFVLNFIATPARGPNGGVHLDMFASFAFFSAAGLLAGLFVSLFAPGWRRKLLLLGANALPMAWVFVEVPPAAFGEVILVLLFAMFGQDY